MTKNLFFFCLMISCLLSCQTTKPVQSVQATRNDTQDYLIEVRSINPSPIISEVMSFLGGRATVNLIDHGNQNYDFIGQHYLQIVCKDVTNTDLQNVLALLGKCQGILEVIYYKM